MGGPLHEFKQMRFLSDATHKSVFGAIDRARLSDKSFGSEKKGVARKKGGMGSPTASEQTERTRSPTCAPPQSKQASDLSYLLNQEISGTPLNQPVSGPK